MNGHKKRKMLKHSKGERKGERVSLYQSLLAGFGNFSGVIWGPDLLGTGTASFTTNEVE